MHRISGAKTWILIHDCYIIPCYVRVHDLLQLYKKTKQNVLFFPYSLPQLSGENPTCPIRALPHYKPTRWRPLLLCL